MIGKLKTEVNCSHIGTNTVPHRKTESHFHLDFMLHNFVIKGAREGQLKLVLISRAGRFALTQVGVDSHLGF